MNLDALGSILNSHDDWHLMSPRTKSNHGRTASITSEASVLMLRGRFHGVCRREVEIACSIFQAKWLTFDGGLDRSRKLRVVTQELLQFALARRIGIWRRIATPKTADEKGSGEAIAEESKTEGKSHRLLGKNSKTRARRSSSV